MPSHTPGREGREQGPGIGGIEPVRHAADRTRDDRRQPRGPDPHELPERRRGPAHQLARQPEVAGGAPAQLAAGGLGYGPRRGQHDLVGGQTQDVGGALAHGPLQGGAAGRVALSGLGHQDQALAAELRIGGGEGRHAALADAGDLAHRLLHLVGVEVAAAADDHVLDPPGQVDLAAGQVGAVAGVVPAVADESSRGLGVAEIAPRRRGSLELQ